MRVEQCQKVLDFLKNTVEDARVGFSRIRKSRSRAFKTK